MIELFSTLRFSVKHGRSVSVTARQQTYRGSNLEQVQWWRGSCSISFEKGKIMERFKELLEKRWRDPRDDPCLMYKPAEKLPWFKRD